MGLFDNLGEGQSSSQLTKETAFLGILMLADYSDGNVSEEEVRTFGTTICRMKLYKDMTEQQLNKHIDKATGIIKRKGLDKALDQFADALPDNLARAAFANAVNQVLADGVVEDEEKDFINNLRRALKISSEDAQMIAKVMVWKNQG